MRWSFCSQLIVTYGLYRLYHNLRTAVFFHPISGLPQPFRAVGQSIEYQEENFPVLELSKDLLDGALREAEQGGNVTVSSNLSLPAESRSCVESINDTLFRWNLLPCPGTDCQVIVG